jgi:hypothetical protein
MDHQEFSSRVKGALEAKRNGKMEEAVADLRMIIAELAIAVRSGVSEWHQQQALSLLIDALDESGNEPDCREAWRALIDMVEQANQYWQEALLSARADFERWEGKPR